jgi:hypothetical protein
MNTHSTDSNSVFCCRSNFTPRQIISLNDPIPEIVKEERKKNKGIVYLPGEKLLLSLAKSKREPKMELDVDRISQSLSRVIISGF